MNVASPYQQLLATLSVAVIRCYILPNRDVSFFSNPWNVRAEIDRMTVFYRFGGSHNAELD